MWVSQDGQNWDFVVNAPWDARHCAGAVVFNDRMWILSGDGLVDVWSSGDGVNWTKELEDAPWGKRYAPYVVVFNGKIWLMGGESFYENPTHGFNDVWSSDDGVNWTLELQNAPWDPRGLIHGEVVFDGKIWLIGGGLKGVTPPEAFQYGDVWNSSDGKIWNKVTDNVPWAPRFHASTTTYNGRIWLTDGSILLQENLSNEVWSSIDGIEWERMEEVPWGPTHATALISFNGSLFLIGGYLRNEIWELNLE